MTRNLGALFYLFIVFSMQSGCAQTLCGQDLNGIWKMRGYGKIIQISDTIVTSYDATAISCTLNSQLKRKDISQLGTIMRVDSNLLSITQGISIYTLDRVAKLPKNMSDIGLGSQDPNSNFDVFWHIMNENYPFFKERKMDWFSIQEKHQRILIKNNKQLRHHVRKIINQLNDGHTTLVIPKRNSGMPHYRTSNKTAVLEDEILKRYVKDPIRYGKSIKGNGLLNYGITENNVGYIQINNMLFFSDQYINSKSLSGYDYLFDYLNFAASNPNHFEDEKRGISALMGQIIEKLQGTNAIIVDLRFNSGGYDLVSLEILRHFIAEKTTVFSKKAKLLNGYTEPQYFSILPAGKPYHKPVFLLTSHQTSSAPEVLALGAMAVKSITRIGSETEGIFSDILEKKLPNGWTLNLSNESYQNMEGSCYEGLGVPPNKRIDYPSSERLFLRTLRKNIKNRDEAIEMVFKLIADK